jgi:hypothetical protein
MSTFWDTVQSAMTAAGDKTKIAAQKAKLKAEMLMIDREIKGRKQAFGIAMYDHLSPLSQSQEFYAANDPLTEMLRPHLISAQREIQALAGKRVKLKQAQAQAEVTRASAFPTKAETAVEKIQNAGKSAYLAGGETKLKAELAICDTQIKGHKQAFGLELFATLVDAEDSRGYLPTDRTVRTIYDQTRNDITNIERKKETKQQELDILNHTNTNHNNSHIEGALSDDTPPTSGNFGGFQDTPNNGNGGGSSGNQPQDADDLLL